MVSFETLVCCSIVLAMSYHVTATEESIPKANLLYGTEQGNFHGTKILNFEGFHKKAKTIYQYISNSLLNFSVCDFKTQPGSSCSNCHQVVRCLPNSLGIVTTCIKYCNKGYCSHLPSKSCALSPTSSTTSSTTTEVIDESTVTFTTATSALRTSSSNFSSTASTSTPFTSPSPMTFTSATSALRTSSSNFSSTASTSTPFTSPSPMPFTLKT